MYPSGGEHVGYGKNSVRTVLLGHQLVGGRDGHAEIQVGELDDPGFIDWYSGVFQRLDIACFSVPGIFIACRPRQKSDFFAPGGQDIIDHFFCGLHVVNAGVGHQILIFQIFAALDERNCFIS